MYDARLSTMALIENRVGDSYCELNATRANVSFLLRSRHLQQRLVAINLKDRPLERDSVYRAAAVSSVPAAFIDAFGSIVHPRLLFPSDRAFNYCRNHSSSDNCTRILLLFLSNVSANVSESSFVMTQLLCARENICENNVPKIILGFVKYPSSHFYISFLRFLSLLLYSSRFNYSFAKSSKL